MNSSAISLLAGVFVGAYFSNPKFKSQIDKGFQGIMSQGIDALNGLNRNQGETNVEQSESD